MTLLHRNLTLLNHISRRYVSALYITGDKAKETFSILTPYMDFTRLQNVERLKANLALRKFDLKLDELLEQWKLYDDIEQRKTTLEGRRVEIAEKIKQISKAKDTPAQQVEQLRNEGKVVREDLKNLKEHSYTLEDVFVHNFLRLPNELHETSGEQEKVLFTVGEPPAGVEKPQSTNLVEWTSPIRYYLKGEAAKFDALLPLFAADFFKQSGFIQFSNPDFVRSILVEAAAVQPESLHQLREEEMENKLNLLHLAGSGSPLSFLGYISKLSLYPTALPLKFVANGKQYSSGTPSAGLHDAPQTTATQFFVACHGPSECDDLQRSLVDDLVRFYKHFEGQHFRVVNRPAHRLQPAESHRIAVEMFSPTLAQYVEVGHVSGYSDFISKRLLFNYREGKSYKFPHLLAGTVVNVERLLALLIEQQQDFRCPEFLTFD
jgi:seryl-tRNA synthetase